MIVNDSGFFKGAISNTTVRTVTHNLYVNSGEPVQLDGIHYIGSSLSYMYHWSGVDSN